MIQNPGSSSDVQLDEILLEVTNLKLHFPSGGGGWPRKPAPPIRAVDGVSFVVHRGETLGLVGESGCGKSSTGRAVLQLRRPTDGSVKLLGRELTEVRGSALRALRREMQMIFQDPYGSLNPRMTVGDLVGEPLEIHGIARRRAKEERVTRLLELVGLEAGFAHRYPHEFSGGQRQRIGIARAISLEPSLVVCDEPVSALDVSIQAQVVNLLEDLQARLGLTYIFIAHDLSVVRHISDRVAVMYLGKLCEVGPKEPFYTDPLHPYSMALLSAVPVPDPSLERNRRRLILAGDVPNPAKPPSGCRFHPRCPFAQAVCRDIEPELEEAKPGRWVACHLWREVEGSGKSDWVPWLNQPVPPASSITTDPLDTARRQPATAGVRFPRQLGPSGVQP